MKFSIDDKVIEKSNLRPHTNYVVSKVVGFLDGNILTIMWGDGFGEELHEYNFSEKVGSRSWRGAVQRYAEDELCTPEEALTILKQLESSKDYMEEEFNKLRSRIQSKMEKAATLVKEAADIISPYEKEFYDLTEECKDLYLALKHGGWSHSTMSCKYGR